MCRQELKKLIIMGVIGFIIGIIMVTSTSTPDDPGTYVVAMALAMGFFMAGLPYGWQLSGKLLGGLLVIGSIPVMVIAFILRLILAMIIGWIAYPIALIYHIVKVCQGNK